MKAFLPLSIAFLFCNTFCTAQNLVPDPGFENARRIPTRRNNSIGCTKSWTQTNGAGDYYHKEGDRHAGVPRNVFGRQKPHSGNAYGGICTRKHFIEYLQTKLSDTLTEGEDYLVELYISRAERSIGRVKEFGVLFGNGYRWGVGDRGIAEKPGVDFTKRGGFRKKKKWMKLSAVYTANGDETTLMLGYFNYNKSKKLRGSSHYYIDDVTVTPVKDNEAPIADAPAETEKTIDTILPSFSPGLGKSIALENIFFETSKSDLLSPSFPELDKLVRFLNTNPSITIVISGHTDNTGNEAQNKLLSESRAKAVSDYLISRGINTRRIKYRGYGSEKPITTNTTEEGRQQNRRVEFVLNKI
jgi:outer membrane protein OmpA-like peptidoglycan-associated protein